MTASEILAKLQKLTKEQYCSDNCLRDEALASLCSLVEGLRKECLFIEDFFPGGFSAIEKVRFKDGFNAGVEAAAGLFKGEKE